MPSSVIKSKKVVKAKGQTEKKTKKTGATPVKAKVVKSAVDTALTAESLSSPERLQALLDETDAELAALQPQLEELEAVLDRLTQLRQTKQKLLTLKLSLQAILQNFNAPILPSLDSPALPIPDVFTAMTPGEKKVATPRAVNRNVQPHPEGAVFLPDEALHAVEQVLRRKNSINFDIYRAIVFHGGTASTEEIKAYLVEQQIRQPNNGKTFDDVALADISSRANYLVRKNIVTATGDGRFTTVYGWQPVS